MTGPAVGGIDALVAPIAGRSVNRCGCRCLHWVPTPIGIATTAIAAPSTMSNNNEMAPFVPDYQTVTLRFDGPPAPPAGVHIGGQLRPFERLCAVCKQPFREQHIVEISNTDPVYRHADCDDPTLADADD